MDVRDNFFETIDVARTWARNEIDGAADAARRRAGSGSALSAGVPHPEGLTLLATIEALRQAGKGSLDGLASSVQVIAAAQATTAQLRDIGSR